MYKLVVFSSIDSISLYRYNNNKTMMMNTTITIMFALFYAEYIPYIVYNIS